ncbi:hypothetical protein RHGRI_012905 [Rhododendron griersonianum]|uniref:Pentatricopeptide repeat-containing protein n=1 Tax=Rhododendron griersonianum TaxID=479676 RepID=A0AAV6K3Q7_9ERIC|nr:hypothetical protein RHGRI_012905 [Rhododendron griersonianum]
MMTFQLGLTPRRQNLSSVGKEQSAYENENHCLGPLGLSMEEEIYQLEQKEREKHNCFGRKTERLPPREWMLYVTQHWTGGLEVFAEMGSQLKDARKLLDAMSEPDVVSWSALFSGYARLGHEIHSRGLKTNGTGISSVLPAVGDLEDFILGSQIHGDVINMGMESDKCVSAPSVTPYESHVTNWTSTCALLTFAAGNRESELGISIS